MTTPQTPATGDTRETKPRLGEWIITGSMLAFFAVAYALAQDFPYRAALFPKIVSALGVGLCVLRLAALVQASLRGRHEPAVAPGSAASPGEPAARAALASTGGAGVTTGAEALSATVPAVSATSELTIVDDDIEDDASMEYVFASAGRRAWFEALAWITFFFVAFFALGAFVSVPLFALLYLRFSGGASWLSAGTYAVVSGVLIYLVFRQLIYIPLPTGLLPFLQV